MTINFDTLALVKHLEKEGAFTRAQAESLAEGLESAVGAEMATKTDLQSLETALRSDLKTLEAALRSDINGLKSDMKNNEIAVKLEMQVLENSMKLWAGGMAFAVVSALSGVMTVLFRVFLH